MINAQFDYNENNNKWVYDAYIPSTKSLRGTFHTYVWRDFIEYNFSY